MSIDEFVAKEKQLIQEFKLWWSSRPSFPKTLGENDWLEQFEFFVFKKNKEDK